MKNQHSRFLAWLLVFSMVLTMMPTMLITASADAPASTATWTKTRLEDIKPTDTVAITMTRGEVTYALPTTIDAEKKAALALACTVVDDALTMSGTDAQYGWHITAAEGGYYITTGENYLSLTTTAKAIVIGKDVQAVWTVNEQGYLNSDVVGNDGNPTNRMFGVYVPPKEGQAPDWRSYGAKDGGVPSNIKDETLNFWVLGGTGSVPTPNPEPKPEPTPNPEPKPEPNPDPKPNPAAGEAALLTELHSGDQVYICNPASSEKGKNRVMSGLGEDGKQFTSVEAEITGSVLSVTAEMLALTVTMDADGSCTLRDENGNYLTVNGKNDMSLESAPSESSVWTLEAAKDKEGNAIAGSFLVKSAATVDEKELYLECYKGNFTSYLFQSWSRPMYTMQFFAAGKTSTGGFTTELAAGDKVVLYQPSSGMALSSAVADNEKKSNLVGTDVTVSDDGVMSGYAEENVWTVGVVTGEKGTQYTFENGGKYLEGYPLALTLGDKAFNWNLSAAEGTDMFFVKNFMSAQLGWSTESKSFYLGFNNEGATNNFGFRFYAIGNGGSGSGSVTKTVATPKASPRSGEVHDGDKVAFTCATEDATILYKTAGAADWTTYTAPIAITEDISFTVKAVKEGMSDSREVTFKYTVYVPPVLGEHKAQLVTDASTLSSGDRILVVVKDLDYAMGQTQKANNRDNAPVIKDESLGLLSYEPESAQIIQLESGIEAGTFSLYCLNGSNTGYLFAPLGSGAQGSNWLRTQDEKDINGSFTIDIAADTTAAITSKADKGSNTIRYNTAGIFSCYAPKGQKAVTIYRLLENNEKPGLPSEGEQVAIYNLLAKGVLSGMSGELSDIYGCTINATGAEIKNGKALCDNGAVIFTVSKSGEFYRFHNEAFGYLCSFGTGNNAYYSTELTDDANWTLEAYNGGYRMKSNAAFESKTQYLQYFSGGFTTWGMYNVTDRDVFTYHFYPCANTKLTDGVVNEPKAVFGNLADALAGQRYMLHFTVDALFGVKELHVTMGGEELAFSEIDGHYTAVIPAENIKGEKLTVRVYGADNKGVAIDSTVDIHIKDEPGITDVRPIANAQTKSDKRPEISAVLANVGTNPTITMSVNGADVAYTYENGKVSYKPGADMESGRVSVTITVTRADGKSVTKTWNFVIGETSYQMLFGQLHSHNGEYSDGAGTLSMALDYIASLPKSANVDFVAFTDHSNYFDTTDAPNPVEALHDMTKATAFSQERWSTYKNTVAQFNETHEGIIGLAGFEMTWSGGPGHINTFATKGIVSRNNKTLNNKSGDAGMKEYYALLSQDAGKNSISQFNHPGTMFGNFSDFNYWNPEADSRMYLVEVGNGEGQIGSSGYYPSYEQYTLALDKGWHLAPSNNQDNHKAKWGNANDARDVILVEQATEEGIYDAIRNYRVYATEDKNLELGYTVNDLPMGTIIESVPEMLKFDVSVMDPDEHDSISKVELIVNSGKVAYTWDDPAELAKGILTVELKPEYSYYYVKVTEADGDLAVTAPVWVGESLQLGVTEMTADSTNPIIGETVTLTTKLYNKESSDAQVKSIIYTTEGSKVLFTDTTPRVLSADSTLSIDWKYVAKLAKKTSITMTVVIEMEGKEYTFSAAVDLDVQDVSSLAYVGVDASHNNEYVSGYNKGLMGNFTALAADSTVRVDLLDTSEKLIAACKDGKYAALVITPPSRRVAEGKDYSEEELKALAAFNAAGGILLISGVGDTNDQLAGAKHTAATQNALLEKLGSSLRLSDDGLYEDSSFTLTLNSFGSSELVKGLTTGISYYGGSTIYTVDAAGAASDKLPATVAAMLFANAAGTSVDKDGDGLGGEATPKYAYAENDARLLVMAAEQLPGKGLIVVSGSTFMNDFDLQIPAANGNNALMQNIFKAVNPVKITPIAEVRKQTESGYKYTIEGVVTSNASGYDKTTAFFDCIYVQDATGGICCFPIAGDFKLGDVVRVTATTHFFQGEAELQVVSAEKLGETAQVKPTVITAAQLNSRSAEGLLATVKGTVTKITEASGLPESIYVKDESGEVARVFIDGYICSQMEIAGLKVGCSIEATGLASYDDTYAIENDSHARLRVRNRAEIICTESAKPIVPVNPGKPEVKPNPGVIVTPGSDKPFSNPFADVANGAWYYDYVMIAARNGLVEGDASGNFRPQAGLTRAELVTLLYRQAGSPAVSGKPSFTDTTREWYQTAIAWAEQNGVSNGLGNGKFAPDAPVTREQMVTMIWRLAGEPASNADLKSFKDADSIPAWAQSAFAWAVEQGIISGTSRPNQTSLYLAPHDNIKRCEAVKILVVYAKLK